MAKGKYAGKKSMNVKPIAMLLAVALLMGTAIGGTLAWLTDDTDPVTNTFTVGDINIKLEETWNADSSNDEDTVNDHWEGKLIPGTDLSKDPKVTVLKDSEACWLFIEVKEENWPTMKEAGSETRKVNYGIRNEWKLVDGKTNIYYRLVPATTAHTPFSILVDDKVTVSSTLTKEEMKNITTPKLTFTAYAIQQANVGTDSSKTEAQNAAVAWKEVSK